MVRRVQKFDISGTYLFHFGTQGSSNGRLKDPVGILIHKGKLYVSVNLTLHFSVPVNNQFSHSFGSNHLCHPHYMTVPIRFQVQCFI